jgi:hypothetical protein
MAGQVGKVSVENVIFNKTGHLAIGLPCPFMCRFSDAGMTMLSRRCGGRRPKSAKARNRGKWGTGGAAGAMEI